jgi:ABC-type Mn2+/Zn2+ transport system ATPase subunit
VRFTAADHLMAIQMLGLNGDAKSTMSKAFFSENREFHGQPEKTEEKRNLSLGPCV